MEKTSKKCAGLVASEHETGFGSNSPMQPDWLVFNQPALENILIVSG
jgi:hypothetical protein